MKIDTSIPSLDESPRARALSLGEETVELRIDGEVLNGLKKPRNVRFEQAGPRPRLFFTPKAAACAVVVCGGLCPGINNVIRSITLTAHRAYAIGRVLGIRYGLEGLCGEAPQTELRPENVDAIHELGGSVLGTSREHRDIDAVLRAVRDMRLDILFLIGGNGTMKAARELSELARTNGLLLSVVGIPKTIDNDIHFVPRSFGFATAVERAADALRCAHTECAGVRNGIGLVRLMGREAGFIAAGAASACRDADFVLIPELPFAVHGNGALIEAAERCLRLRSHVLIAVAEGAGQHLCTTDGAERPDIALLLMETLGAHLRGKGIRHSFKFIDPGYMVRAVPANPSDGAYCGALGGYAVHAAMAGRTEMVVAEIAGRFVHLPLRHIAGHRRKLDLDSSLWRSVRAHTEPYAVSESRNKRRRPRSGRGVGHE